MKQYLIIYTGGTIGMIKDDNGVLIPGSLSLIKAYLHQNLNSDTIKFDIVGFNEPIDSVNFNHYQFNKLLTIIQKNYEEYDGFLVLIGTDTMAYIGSLLSFCIEGLNKPVLLTGSQQPLYELNSDGSKNLIGSINYLMNRPEVGVGIFFNKKYIPANIATKIDSVAEDAFVAVKPQNLIQTILEDHLDFIHICDTSILVLTIHPFIKEQALITAIENRNVKMVVFQNLGSGNNPSFSVEFFKCIQQLQTNGVCFVVTTQCLRGGITIGKYESSNLVSQLKFLDAKTMTLEAIVAKGMYLFAKNISKEEFKTKFESNLRGEI